MERKEKENISQKEFTMAKQNEKEVNSDKEKLGLFSVEKLQFIIIPAWAC